MRTQNASSCEQSLEKPRVFYLNWSVATQGWPTLRASHGQYRGSPSPELGKASFLVSEFMSGFDDSKSPILESAM